jgi:hypothetical protein
MVEDERDDVTGKGASDIDSRREAKSTDAPERGVPPSSAEADGTVDEIRIVRDAHSAEPGAGFDLDVVALSDAYLIELAMRVFGIDPNVANAREQLHRALSRKLRPSRRGRSPAIYISKSKWRQQVRLPICPHQQWRG